MILKTFDFDKVRLEGEEVVKERATASFYFSADVLLNLNKIGIKGVNDLGEALQSGDLGKIAGIGWLAHRTACRLKKTDLVIESVDEMSDLIDTVGIVEFAEYVGNAISEVMRVEMKQKKRAVKAKS